MRPPPPVVRNPEEDLSKTFQKYILSDEELAGFKPDGKLAQAEKTVFALGRFTACLAGLQTHASALKTSAPGAPFSHAVYKAVIGAGSLDQDRARMLEAIIVASVDHGVTPPSAQATLIASSVRASYEVAIAQGVGAITDIHGGAGEKAAVFFRRCADLASRDKLSFEDSTRAVIRAYIREGKRIEGMGHRVHTQDPRRDVLWRFAEKTGLAGPCVAISRIVGDMLREVRGLSLPINVDGVIGAIIADMSLDPRLAKALFIFGRIMGLSAHYFEEVTTQAPMRAINFSQAVYRGNAEKSYPV